MSCSLKSYIWLIITALLGVLVCLAIFFWAEIADDNPVVRFEMGIIQGLRSEEGHTMYLGIPYAKINRTNRFGISTPYGPLKTHYEAYNHKSKALCPCSRQNQTLETTSDCLYFNIYIPKTSQTNMPVLVYIYNDIAKELDFNTIKNMLEHNILMVTIYYRTDIYGFMCLNSSLVPGNQGFKDQILGLKWIKNYIQEFGGDNNSITVIQDNNERFGIDFHMSYGEEKLYDRIILDNATAFYPTILQDANNSVPLILAKELGCESDNIEDTLTFLSSMDELSLIKTSEKLNITFKPCIETELSITDNFISENDDINNIRDKSNITVFILQNKEQIEHRTIDMNTNYSLSSFYNVLHKFNIDEDRFKDVESLIKKAYVHVDNNDEQIKYEVNDFASDMYHYYPMRKGIKKYLKNGAKVYYGLYSHNGHLNSLTTLFSESLIDNNPIVIHYIQTFWTNFIKYGDPSALGSLIPSLNWQEATDNEIHYVDIDTELSIALENIQNNNSREDVGSFYKINKILEKFN